MKKIMVYAYTVFNLGDDLFIKILCNRYPNIKFVIYAPREYKYNFKEMNNLEIVPSDRLIIKVLDVLYRKFKGHGFFRKLIAKSCDAAVYIGGSLFIERDRWRRGLGDVKNMKLKDKPFFLLGANFGPYKDKEFYKQYKGIFKGYTDICFREKYSYNIFNDLSNVRVADDIIFQLKTQMHEEKNKNIVISVIKPSIRKHLVNYEDMYYKKIKDISIYFIEKGYQVTLMSFCEHEGDSEAVEKIIDLIPNTYLSQINKYFYKLDIEEALSIIARSSFVVATRFHSMILGWLYNKPVFPIVYSEKMTNVMDDVGFNGLYSDFESIELLNPEDVFNSMRASLLDISRQVDNSENHFKKLDEYLLTN